MIKKGASSIVFIFRWYPDIYTLNYVWDLLQNTMGGINKMRSPMSQWLTLSIELGGRVINFIIFISYMLEILKMKTLKN